MKKVIISILTLAALSVTVSSCTKNSDKITEGKTNVVASVMSNIVLPSDANGEVERIFNDVQNVDYVFGIIANPNFGVNKNADISFSGMTPSDVSVSINNITYTNTSGQWFQQSTLFPALYGSTVNVTITKGNSQFVKSMYVPNILLADKICDDYQEIERTGNTLTWTSDPNNTMNKIAFSYELYDNSDPQSSGAAYDKDIILIDDNGTYNFDNLVSDAKCKRINFMLITGNAFSFTVNQKKYLFNLFSANHHEYMVKN